MIDATTRFSDRVAYYIKARPHYPPRLLELMQSRLGLRPGHAVADVGSGTGILSELLLRHGNIVYGVEPNEPMRRAAEQLLAGYPNFRSVAAAAEATTLPEASVDFITAGQAFHWFDPDRSREEFARILRREPGGGWVLLAWNDRRPDRPPFAVAYDRVVRAYNTDLERIDHRKVSHEHSAALDRLFGPGGYQYVSFDNPRTHDWEGIRARLLSSSYMPLADGPRYEAMLRELKLAFDAYAQDGVVQLEYDTRVYFGRINAPPL